MSSIEAQPRTSVGQGTSTASATTRSKPEHVERSSRSEAALTEAKLKLQNGSFVSNINAQQRTPMGDWQLSEDNKPFGDRAAENSQLSARVDRLVGKIVNKTNQQMDGEESK